MKKIIALLALCCSAGLKAGSLGPFNPELGSAYTSDSPKYESLGYDQKTGTFYAVIDPGILNSQKQINGIVVDIFKNNSGKFNFTNSFQVIMFLKDKSVPNKIDIRRDDVLAEYRNNNNRVTLYPYFPSRNKWFHGPKELSKQ
jgi:hypothetical protein